MDVPVAMATSGLSRALRWSAPPRHRHVARAHATATEPPRSVWALLLQLADGRSWLLLGLGLLLVGSSKTVGFLAPFALRRAVNLLSHRVPRKRP